MAKQTTVRFVDDLDGSEASGTFDFSLEGRQYQVDLSDKNAAKLRDALAQYVGAGRSVGGARRGGRKSASSATNLGPSAREVRDWARSNGFDVPDRGRIPADVRTAFDAAN